MPAPLGKTAVSGATAPRPSIKHVPRERVELPDLGSAEEVSHKEADGSKRPDYACQNQGTAGQNATYASARFRSTLSEITHQEFERR